MPASPPRRDTWLSNCSEGAAGTNGVFNTKRAIDTLTLALVAQVATLALPLALLYSRAAAEVLIAVVDGVFLLHVAGTRDTAWLRRPYTLAALPWWGWIVLCSALGPGGVPSVVQALVAVRFFVFAAALGDWVLVGARTRRLLWVAVAAAAAWIALETWQQYLTGSNIFGAPRWIDGALTGPFAKPRAGAGFALVLFPALLVPVMALLRGGRARQVAGVLLASGGVLTMLLIGQRMPALLTLLGLLVSGLLLPRFRPALIGALVAGAVLLAATPALSPRTYDKLVVHFRSQIADFSRSPYGLLATRAVVMTEDHPLLGLGLRGFRIACDQPQYGAGIGWLGIRDTSDAGPEACNLHPHNFYLEAATSGGLPGLALFGALALAWLAVLGRGLLRTPDPVRVGLFVTVLMALWPIASTSEFFSVPNCGWLFLALGWGFAAQASTAELRSLPAV
jgi:hypothetical protein